LAFHIIQFAQLLTELVPARRIIDDSDALDFTGHTLRARRERPTGRRAGKTGDEVASPHGRCPRAEQHFSTSSGIYGAVRNGKTADVRFGSKADIGLAAVDVRFTPESRHCPATVECLLCAMNRTAVLYALISAALFGVSTPAAKLLIGSIHPVTLAGTALMAWFIFHENFDRRIAIGMASLVAGAAVLSWSGAPTFDNIVGPLAIVGACVAWGLDNNLTRKVSLADPLQIAMLKGLIAGPFNLILGLSISHEIPNVSSILLTGIVGFLGYGVSLALFVVALRDLGTARTAAYFSTAPFIGSAVALIVLGEPVTAQLLAAGALMAFGVWLHLTEHHEHEHVHEALVHAHPHVHDIHHRHAHSANDPPGEPHTHSHEHRSMRHAHPHVPDMHHTHRHS
jgi:multidrug transporter EmrE-like cation transporter